MKKLLIYCHHFYPMNTGYSNAFQNLINSVLDNFDDIEITVVTPCALENKNELNRKRLEIIRLAPRTNIRKLRYFINDWYHAKYVSGLFKEKCFDLLLIETFDQAFFINCLDKDLFDKVLVRIHSTSETEYTIFNDSFTHRVRKFIIQKSLMKKVINIASTNSFHIEFAKKHYLKDNLLSIANKNFFVIPNAVKEIDRSLINFEKKGKINLFTLGRMDSLGMNQKGFFDFISALKLLSKNVLECFEVTIVGSGSEKKRLIDYAGNLANVTFIDHLSHDETLNCLLKSDLVVLPSRYEGLSMFALEGLATGNAVIFSKTGGLVDLVEQNGLFFEPQNIEDLAKSLTVFSQYTDQEIKEMKINSLSIIDKKFSAQVVAGSLMQVIDLCSSSSSL